MNSRISIAVLFFFFAFPVFSQTDNRFIWANINGNWTVESEHKTLTDSGQKIARTGYSELLDTRSIVSNQKIQGITSIKTAVTLSEPEESNSFTVFFASREYRSFFGFRLTGDSQKISAVQFINSEPKDPSIPYTVKNSFEVKTLAEKTASAAFGKEIKILIELKNKTAVLYLNGKKALSYDIENSFQEGFIGFSHTENKISISEMKCFSGKKIVFEDDFSADKIKRYKAVFNKKTNEKKEETK